MDGILIPVKRLEKAKQRLAGTLEPHERLGLGLAMLSDVLLATSRWTTRFVVTRDGRAAEVARSLGCRVVPEQGAGLNSALSAGTEHAVSGGVKRLLILPADVPAVTQADVETLFSFPHEVVVASSQDGGTTALLRSPPAVMETAFGPGSACAHLERAQNAGLDAKEITLASLLLDVDDFDDLRQLAARSAPLRSVLLARRLVERMPA